MSSNCPEIEGGWLTKWGGLDEASPWTWSAPSLLLLPGLGRPLQVVQAIRGAVPHGSRLDGASLWHHHAGRAAGPCEPASWSGGGGGDGVQVG